MECTFQNYLDLKVNGDLISLESTENLYPYWCYPINAKPIGLEGCILYCFIDGYDEMVFACNPETSADTNVYPLARDFKDFMRLILACGSVNPVEQIVWMNKKQFEEHLESEALLSTEEHKSVLKRIETAFELSPIDCPYEYVKELQKDFDMNLIQYSDEYYDVLGIERP